jgi:hypothetical protein
VTGRPESSFDTINLVRGMWRVRLGRRLANLSRAKDAAISLVLRELNGGFSGTNRPGGNNKHPAFLVKIEVIAFDCCNGSLAMSWARLAAYIFLLFTGVRAKRPCAPGRMSPLAFALNVGKPAPTSRRRTTRVTSDEQALGQNQIRSYVTKERTPRAAWPKWQYRTGGRCSANATASAPIRRFLSSGACSCRLQT